MSNLRTEIMDFGGFDSSRILILRGGILMSIGNFPESLSQAILAEIILVGTLGVWRFCLRRGSLARGPPLEADMSLFCLILQIAYINKAK